MSHLAEIIECPACDGYGVEVYATWEYEHGCGFGHASSDERPCPECGGAGIIETSWEPDPFPLSPLEVYLAQ